MKLREAMILACKKQGDNAMVTVLQHQKDIYLEGYGTPYYALRRKIKRD